MSSKSTLSRLAAFHMPPFACRWLARVRGRQVTPSETDLCHGHQYPTANLARFPRFYAAADIQKINQAETRETAETKTATTEVATAEIAKAETAITKIAITKIEAIGVPQAAIAITATSIQAREKFMKSARTKTNPHIHSH